MPQSSLVAWLTQSPVVHRPPEASAQSDKPNIAREQAAFPTPTQSTPDKVSNEGQAGEAVTEPMTEAVPAIKRTALPCNAEIRACAREDIPQLKRLNGLLLPIPYPEAFYREIIEDNLTNSVTLLAFWHDDVTLVGKEKGHTVGAIRCRILAHSVTRNDKKPMLYLSTLVLLSPYRAHGLATYMLHVITKRAVERYGVGSIGAHVWEANAEALEWYRKRGFRKVAREEGYYRKLNPMTAVVVQRDVAPRDLLDEGAWPT